MCRIVQRQVVDRLEGFEGLAVVQNEEKAQYDDEGWLKAAKAACYQRCLRLPLKVSELMKAGRPQDAAQRFGLWLVQQGCLAALNEIYGCEIQGNRPRSAQLVIFSEALQLGQMNEIDVTGAYFQGYQQVASDYIKWVESLSLMKGD